MAQVEGITRKWGSSSLVFVIPKKIVEKEKLKENQKIKALLLKEKNVLPKSFGILKQWKKSTEKIMKEIDEELWFEE